MSESYNLNRDVSTPEMLKDIEHRLLEILETSQSSLVSLRDLQANSNLAAKPQDLMQVIDTLLAKALILERGRSHNKFYKLRSRD